MEFYRRPKPYFFEVGVDIGIPLTVCCSGAVRCPSEDHLVVQVPEKKIVAMDRDGEALHEIFQF